MNNSNDFMNNSYEDKIQSLRQGRWTEEETIFRSSTRGIGSPLARVRSAISVFVGGKKDRDINQS